MGRKTSGSAPQRAPAGRPDDGRAGRRADRPAAKRQVIGLIYHQNWALADIANLFGVSTRTVQRWRDAAVAKLKGRIGDW